jgi:hypothetical protein
VTTTVVCVRAVVDTDGTVATRHEVAYLGADGRWTCDAHPRARSCECRVAVAALLEQANG